MSIKLACVNQCRFKYLSDTYSFMRFFSYFRILLPLIIKKCLREACIISQTSREYVALQWLDKSILKTCDIILKIPEGCWVSMAFGIWIHMIIKRDVVRAKIVFNLFTFYDDVVAPTMPRCKRLVSRMNIAETVEIIKSII